MKKIFCVLYLFTIVMLLQAESTYTISGRISGSADVILTLTGVPDLAAVPDNNGYYEFNGLIEGNTYTITPVKNANLPQVSHLYRDGMFVSGQTRITAKISGDTPVYSFTPMNRVFTDLACDWTNQDFAVSVSDTCSKIVQVQYFVDNTLLYTDNTASTCQTTYWYLWDADSSLMGLHKIRVTALDENNNTGSAEFKVLIWNNSLRIDGNIPGDVDSNGTVNIVDALMTAQYGVGLSVPNFNAAVADVDYNGVINVLDAHIILFIFFGPL